MIARYNIHWLARLLFAASLYVWAGLVNAQPQENLKVTRFEFGMFPIRSTVAHTFWFTAPAHDTLRLLDVKTGCRCLRAEKNQNFAGAGDSLPVTLLWSPDSETDTNQTAYLFFYGNPDPIRLTLTSGAATPNAFISVVPPAVEFPTARNARKQSAGVRVTNTTEHELALKVVSVSSDNFTVVVPDKINKGELVTAQIGLTQPDDTTRFQRSFTLEATDATAKKSYRVTIPVRRGTVAIPTTEMTR